MSNKYTKGVITIKKIYFILISLLVFSIVSCESQESINRAKPISVSIETDVDTYGLYMSSVRGITLTPKLEGNTNKDIQYHWLIDSELEKFETADGPQKEIINSGEPVLFIVTAEIDYFKPDTLSKEIKVTLLVEEKGSDTKLAETELIIEDYSGTYKVKK